MKKHYVFYIIVFALIITNTTQLLSQTIVTPNYSNISESSYNTTSNYAYQNTSQHSIKFNGITDYIDMDDRYDLNSGTFTLSAWILLSSNSLEASIVSKRNHLFTEGYDFKINASGHLEFAVKNNNSLNQIISNTVIPTNTWHQVAIIFNGTEAKLYIDGVLDNSGLISSPTDTNYNFILGAAGKPITNNYFEGNIDELRIWNIDLTEDQLRFLMNQEIEAEASVVKGKITGSSITKNTASQIPWNALEGYYPMSVFTLNTTQDESNHNHVGILNDINMVDQQTAPLPYKSNANGDWDSNASWLNGNYQTLPGATSIVDNSKTINWNIVETNHNISLDNNNLPHANSGNRTVLSLEIKTDTLSLEGDNTIKTGNGLTVTHYLKIDGKIDLNGESQLIQTTGSDFDPQSSGTLERDQQGTKDLFTYNYWSSPVGESNTTTNNNSYTLPNIFKDGTNPDNPVNINFLINGYNGTDGTPIGIADFWIWKYSNQSGSYSNWQHVRSTGSILPGEGFSMKGVTDTSGNIPLEQNYVIEGKPNNGNITLPVTIDNKYLIGNPYASALDADQFIMDNAPTINSTGNTTGTLYFWEHWGGDSHNLADYQGGYGTYNLSGAAPSASFGTNDPALATGGRPTKLPGRYIPVAQGFFVISEATGTIKFNNNQRVFQKEDNPSSVYIRATSESTTNNGDNRLKIRLGINSVNSIHRQLLVTQDPNATSGKDWGYDGVVNHEQMDDIFWMIENNKFVIQGTDIIDVNTILPIGIKTSNTGDNTFTIDALENVPNNLNIYIHDSVNETYHDIRQADFTINLTAGEYLNRFELVFSNPDALSIEEVIISDINTYYSNNLESIVIHNPKLKTIKSLSLYNIVGQKIIDFNDIKNEDYIELKTDKLSSGTYIIKLNTDEGEVSKKVLID